MRHKNLAVAAFVLTLCGVFSSASARTWYVNVSGTGDAPTIQAALDSAVAGDSVLVGPGTYHETIGIPASVVLKSELGPLQTSIIGVGEPGIPQPPFAIIAHEYATLDGFTADGAYLYTVACNDRVVIRNNIITRGLEASNYNLIEHNLFFTPGLVAIGGYQVAFIRNIVFCDFNCQWDTAALWNDFVNTWSQCAQDLVGPESENFSLDPQFCGVEGSGNYYLQSDSPCAEGNGPYPSAGQVGPLPVGCSTVKTEAKSWGAIKALYQ